MADPVGLPVGKMTGLVTSGEMKAIQVSVLIDGVEHQISVELSAWQQRYLHHRFKAISS